MEHISHTLKEHFKTLQQRYANYKIIQEFEKNDKESCCDLFKLFDYHDLIQHKNETRLRTR